MKPPKHASTSWGQDHSSSSAGVSTQHLEEHLPALIYIACLCNGPSTSAACASATAKSMHNNPSVPALMSKKASLPCTERNNRTWAGSSAPSEFHKAFSWAMQTCRFLPVLADSGRFWPILADSCRFLHDSCDLQKNLRHQLQTMDQSKSPDFSVRNSGILRMKRINFFRTHRRSPGTPLR